jgi:glycosyltransferase involved in cell wall biosynthesis
MAAMNEQGRSLAIVAEMLAWRDGPSLRVHFSFGRVIDSLAPHFERVYVCMPVQKGPPDLDVGDYCLQSPNIHIIPQPGYASTAQALWHPLGIAWTCVRVCRSAEVVFVRGMLPFGIVLYLAAWLWGRGICHWVVGNPVASAQSHRRAGWLKDRLFLLYAWQDRALARLGRWLADGVFLCNGDELGRIFASPRTVVTVSSTVRREELYERRDTCRGPLVRILYVGYIRPEKGLEYLLQAVAQLKIPVPWELVLVGRVEKYYGAHARLTDLARRLGIQDRLRWEGYVSYGPRLFEYYRQADLFVLPTLSEGTPRVLVEARANSLPLVSTNVGGISTSVTDGYDGILVPAKDPAALAAAIERIVLDGEFRRTLIVNGYRRVQGLTLEGFVDKVVECTASRCGP